MKSAPSSLLGSRESGVGSWESGKNIKATQSEDQLTG